MGFKKDVWRELNGLFAHKQEIETPSVVGVWRIPLPKKRKEEGKKSPVTHPEDKSVLMPRELVPETVVKVSEQV